MKPFLSILADIALAPSLLDMIDAFEHGLPPLTLALCHKGRGDAKTQRH
jgi:hypothetical protein